MTTTVQRTSSLLITFSLLGGCSAPPSGAAETTSESPTDVSRLATSHEAVVVPGMQPDTRTVTGTVAETMDVAGYTYLRLDTGSESIWIAASQFVVEVGERLAADLDAPMADFYSKTLDRRFPSIYFVSRIAREGEPTLPEMRAGHQPTDGRAPSDGEPLVTAVIEPPTGGTTVADVWVNRPSLAGTTVTVRGKVVKFNGGILGRNWVHIQDGTGTATDGSNDLVITTDATARVGDVVTATGAVAVDKDFGAGYSYAVMLEGASLTVK